MKDQLISTETAKLANSKGIKDCMINGILITQSLLQKILREKHKIILLVYEGFEMYSEGDYLCYEYKINHITEPKKDQRVGDNCQRINSPKRNYNTYEEALEEGLQEALKILNI